MKVKRRILNILLMVMYGSTAFSQSQDVAEVTGLESDSESKMALHIRG